MGRSGPRSAAKSAGKVTFPFFQSSTRSSLPTPNITPRIVPVTNSCGGLIFLPPDDANAETLGLALAGVHRREMLLPARRCGLSCGSAMMATFPDGPPFSYGPPFDGH